jgi:FxLD family lantipeptide
MNEIDESEFTLDVTLVDAGPTASGYATGTDDGCGSGNTGSSACTGRTDLAN